MADSIDFTKPETRLRLSPQTVIRVRADDQVELQHPSSEQGMQMKYDIMLILYGLMDWNTVGAICEGWPPEDQVKIQDYLAQFYHSKIIITSEAELGAETSSEMPGNVGNQVTIHIENHHHMLRDSIRMRCYEQAIRNTVKPEDVVMDLGSGSGILSMFSARAGAKKVYAIEKRPDMVLVSRQIIEANGYNSKIEVIEKASHQLQPDQMADLPTVFVSEILGNAILEENVLEFTLDARERLLASGARMIPASLEIMLVPFDAGPMPDRAQEVSELEGIYGFDLGVMKQVLSGKPVMRLERFTPSAVTLISDPVCAKSLDFATFDSPRFQERVSFIVKADGYLNAFCAYFKAHLDKHTVLTNSPWAPSTHWTQAVFYFPDRRSVKAGERIDMQFRYDGGMTLWFEADYPDA